MNVNLLPLIILLPSVFAAAVLMTPAKLKNAHAALVLAGFGINLILVLIAAGKELTFFTPWIAGLLDFDLRLYHFSSVVLIGAAGLSFLVVLYTVAFAREKAYFKPFNALLLITMTLVNGAILANNLMLLLFFWEGILGTMFGLIYLGGKDSYKTSVKAVIISGVTDLIMMLGIGVTGWLAHTLTMNQIHLPMGSWGTVAFLFLMIGAMSKAGAMPFHTWIPDAANDAPMPFMAFLPAAIEKLLGIYLTARVCLDLFELTPGTPMSLLIMIIGAATILFAVMMALIQKDFKRLLSYHAVSQVGYMLLGIGTALPVGIVGGLFHMLNHAIYKCCLFLTSGSVEKQTGTTDLKKLGGLGRKMPITFACFIVAAASIAGFPMTNGFFSKELIFDGALESGKIFYIVALLGAFFTSVSFLKLGHAAFMGKPTEEVKHVKEAPVPMLISMIVLAAACLGLGFGHGIMTSQVFTPVVAAAREVGEAVGEHTNWLLVTISVIVMALAFLDHYIGFRATGKGLEAADHFHYAPGLHTVYGLAEKKYFDPYYVLGFAVKGYGVAALWVNNGISWIYDVLIVKLVGAFASIVKWAHNGSQSRYVIWSLFGTALIAVVFLLSL